MTPSEINVKDSKALEAFSPRLRRLLALRDITTEEDADVFLHPDWERDTHDAFLMKDMKRVVDRIVQAIIHGETIALWSDYDMDGIPGAVVLHDYFRAIGYEHVLHYTPHRNKEGFGLNSEGVDELSTEHATLIITIDCGITDTEAVSHANEKGVDVIITDHHISPGELPDAYAILNPKQKGCSYPEKMLCGAGVVFKLIQALVRDTQNHETIPTLSLGWEKWRLDMVGMATVADMVPLSGENRTFAYYGRIVLQKSRRLGLQALLRKARANQRYLNEDDVAFTIAPRINAASRMGHAKDAFTLLTAEDGATAGALADELDRINKERKTVVATMKREINRTLKKQSQEKAVIVLGSPKWKPSLLGLVAGSLVSDYDKPVFLWGREAGKSIKGSCRSKGAPGVHELLEEIESELITYGGHACSGGFSIEGERVHNLEQSLLKAYEKLSTGEVAQEAQYDDELILEDVTWDTYREIARLGPFGMGNAKPLFLVRVARVQGVRTFGKGNEHIEVQLQREAGGTVKAMAFFTKADDFTKPPVLDETVSLLAYLEESHFMGRSELRLRIVDVV